MSDERWKSESDYKENYQRSEYNCLDQNDLNPEWEVKGHSMCFTDKYSIAVKSVIPRLIYIHSHIHCNVLIMSM